ncbi:hypothetical protein JWJ88_19585 [Paracoccus methylovorus]|uniref:DUF3617 family protein n=1 Tax=Paracoccus methylovorus TaxID=2812658 RepID=A0ABX7JLL5_9RHOB|nr:MULTISPECIES: hypothetical protein [Paracoccus]QRZ13661.1 hypothetical protein JWJ88_03065 [Paracoccus methylovorus]QRZ15137.1 hypothetical protein JWJ88_19585 [Paracoccus methylovorus]
MKSFAAAAILAITAAPASAALSGYWDNSKIIHATLGNDMVADALKQQPVESITSTESGYQIQSQDCRVDVQVTRTAPDRPGPTRFSLKIGKGQCS